MSYENEAMTDRKLAEKLREAMNEPTVPSGLVERWAARAGGIERGRAAERQLADTRQPLTPAEQADLAAACVVGRMMTAQMPPQGVTAEMLEEQLKAQPVFADAVRQPRERLVREIRTGEIFGRLTADRGREPPAPDAPGLHTPAPEEKKRSL